MQFDDDFVKDFMQHRLPIQKRLFLASQVRPQLQDCMFFLIWRSYCAGQGSLIPWNRLRDQFWQADSNRSRIRLRFAEIITLLRTETGWSELNADARIEGLWIAPPRNGVQFLSSLDEPEHVKKRRQRKFPGPISRPEARRALIAIRTAGSCL